MTKAIQLSLAARTAPDCRQFFEKGDHIAQEFHDFYVARQDLVGSLTSGQINRTIARYGFVRYMEPKLEPYQVLQQKAEYFQIIKHLIQDGHKRI